MNSLREFKNSEFGTIHSTIINNEPWFVGKDVAEALGYKNTRDALRKHVDSDDMNTVANRDGNRGNPNQTLINESGLYSLILSSKLPSARNFKKWVTSEVLPTIRKHGMYATDELINNPDLLISVATELKNERMKANALETTVKQLKPKASYYDLVLQSKDLVSTTQIAKDYGKSATWLNKRLHDLGIQYKSGETWVLYQKYAGKGYAQSKTHTYVDEFSVIRTKLHTYWTQKGRLFLYEKLREHDIYPVMEWD